MSIELNRLTLKRGDQTIVKQLDLVFPAQKITAICGPNGAGKSTLMHALSGELLPTQGNILYQNQSITDYAPAELAEIRAFMPQQVELAFSFSVQQIIETGLFLTTDKRMLIQLVSQVSEWFDIKALLNKAYANLSGGQQQRVQLARVVAQLIQAGQSNQRYLLLDECSSAMDIATVQLVFNRLRELLSLLDSELTIIAVMHDLNLASLYADELVLLGKGGHCLQGLPESLLTEAYIQQVFKAKVHVTQHPTANKPMVLPSFEVVL